MSITSSTTLVTCHCQDRDVVRLRELIAAGHDQFSASRYLWGGPDVDLPPALSLLRDLAAERARIRAAFARAFPWLRISDTREAT